MSDTGHGSDWTANGARYVRLTEVGLILLITGIVPDVFLGLFWFYRLFDYFPILGYLGFFLFVAGALLIVLGRKPFGRRHSNYAIFSVSIIAVVNALLATGNLSFNFPNAPHGAIEVILTAVQGISVVLLTYGLQEAVGRILLWSAYAFSMVWSVILVYEGWRGPLGFLAGPISIPLTLASSGIFTVAFSLAYSRLKKKVIPASLFVAEAPLTNSIQ